MGAKIGLNGHPDVSEALVSKGMHLQLCIGKQNYWTFEIQLMDNLSFYSSIRSPILLSSHCKCFSGRGYIAVLYK